ncbi:MAG TPA: cbb3-type cytochrome c oxidase subunit I [Candidatus Baltobacteraceae bacterium]|nr:cbb3-type cytochrome c oxidase subunit I [Candidatus Baltobacteraceae bacterium]
MVTYDDGAGAPQPARGSFLARYVFSTHHKMIGLQYLWLALASVFVGVVLSTLLRVHTSWPDTAIPFLNGFENTPERYAAVRLLHGSLMVFFVLTAAPQLGFGNYLLPLQIGASEMAFPTLNLVSFWLTEVSLVGMTASFFYAPETGINVWLGSAAIFSVGALLSALNFTTTTIDLRAEGMTLPRLPVTVWAWFLNAILSLLIFSVLLAGCATLLSDRLLGSQFFSVINFLAAQPQNLVRQGSLPALWQRLFWYFAQAEVYVAMLPCFGIVTHLVSTFSRKPVWMERLVVVALCGVGVIGFCVWGYHMFATGMNPYAPLVFAVLASSLGVPAAFLLASWLGTLWDGRLQLTTAMLFSIGFISLFIAGGLSGIFLARQDLSSVAVSEDFVIGHFHLVMGVAATFAILGALFFWFPKMFGCRLSEPLGKVHFWMTFVGVYLIFMPMHWLGLLTQSRLLPDAQRAALATAGTSIRTLVTLATICTVSAQVLFVINFAQALARRKMAAEEDNPWRATTLEWSVASPAPEANFGDVSPIVYRGAYEFPEGFASDFAPQHLAPELLAQRVR